MKATELIIGDWVSCGGTPIRVENIHGDCINFQHDIPFVQEEFMIDFAEIVPISLTPEILEKNKFNQVIDTCKIKTYHRKPINVIMFSTPEITILPEESFIIKNLKIQYVHEFQHILRLCGMNELADNFKI